MSIASEINRLRNAKATLKTKMTDAGYTFSDSATIDELIDLLSLSGGACGANALYITIY